MAYYQGMATLALVIIIMIVVAIYKNNSNLNNKI